MGHCGCSSGRSVERPLEAKSGAGEAGEHEVLSAAIAARFDIPAEVTDDRCCAGCGYNLRGLSTSGECPECGAPIWPAFTERAILMASPEWLGRLRSGTALIGAAGAIVLWLSMLARGIAQTPFVRNIAFLSTMGIAAVLATLGVWFVTTPNTAVREPVPHRRHAIRARTAMLASLAGGVWAATLVLGLGWSPTVTFAAATASPLGVAGWLCLRELSLHFEELARAVGGRFVVQRAGLYRRLLDVCAAGLGLAYGIGVLAGPAGACVGLLPGAAYVGVAILIVSLPVNLAAELAELAHATRELREQTGGKC